METPEQIRDRLLARFPGTEIVLVPTPPGPPSLLVGAAFGREIAQFLRDDPELRLDYCSNATGVDSPEKEIVETVNNVKVKKVRPGYLEVVYHLYSMSRKQGPLVLRLRTGNRTDQVTLPSLTPVWRSCEFQEREVFDLFGVIFTGHPDLRRILMWDEFKDHPMRKDYVEPDDYEWEPTPHDAVALKAQGHQEASPSVAPTGAKEGPP